MIRTKKSAGLAVVLLLIVSTLATAFSFSEKQPVFKNLKVLPKTISRAALDKIMDEYCYALKTGCDFCHKQSFRTKEFDYASDSKGTKEITRNMMRMTDDINKKYFNYNRAKIIPRTVTCFTCHRQSIIPAVDSVSATPAYQP